MVLDQCECSMYQFCIRLPQYRGKKTCISRGGQSPISEKENQMNESRIECQVLHTVILTIKVGTRYVVSRIKCASFSMGSTKEAFFHPDIENL